MPDHTPWSVGRFFFEHHSTAYFKAAYVIVPDWALVIPATALPTVRLVRLGLRGRARAGLCPTCNYDLRATPDRCPECGAVPKGATV